VRKLEPGHWLLWRETGAVMVHPYWDLPRHETPAPPDIADRLVEWLDDSVAAHLVSDVPVAAFLSGGLDSSAVVASMAVAGEGPPHAFTARYFGSGAADTDETELARQLARRYDARLTIVDIRPNLRESFEPIVRALDEPHADDSAVPTWALSQAVGSSYKVALTGMLARPAVSPRRSISITRSTSPTTSSRSPTVSRWRTRSSCACRSSITFSQSGSSRSRPGSNWAAGS